MMRINHRRLFLLVVLALSCAALPLYSAHALGIWAAGTPMLGRHSYASAIGLRDGRVLVIGGYNDSTAEVYDPRADRWSPAGTILNRGGSSTLLNDGKVLLAGGGVYDSPTGVIARAFLYDPAANSWSEAAPMAAARLGHQATLLPNGKVLVTGGAVSLLPTIVATSSAELYDPATGQWSAAAPMHTPRSGHAAVWLPSGKLVVIGGDASGGAVELYDPQFDQWTPAAAMPSYPGADMHQGFTATWLPNNAILVVGTGVAAIYYPATDSWSPTAPMQIARFGLGHSATLLPSGKVLVAGGATMVGASRQTLAEAELYDWQINGWAATAPMLSAREGHTATVLNLDQLLVSGGSNTQDLVSTERYGEERMPERCFAETGTCARGRFLAYWQQHGGLAINGYPLSDEFIETLEDGRAYSVQYFERVRMEFHPENPAPYTILLGQFGRRIHPADPPSPAVAGARYFGETGHNLGGSFLRYWQRNGGLAQFGYPLSEEFSETLEDGQSYVVQYFERARFEHHPEKRPPYDVLLGQFGRRILGERRS